MKPYNWIKAYFFKTNQRIVHTERFPKKTVPRFTRVTLDRLLTLGPHIQSISTKTAARCRVLASLTSKEWGWRKDQLMKVYKALQLSLLTYTAPAWQPWAAPSHIEQLERCQNKALRVVTGQLKFTQLKHSDERSASAASKLRPSAQWRWLTRRHTGCLQTTQEGKS